MGRRDDAMAPGADADPVAERRSLLSDMWHTRMWRIFPLMFLYVVGIAMIAPQVPGERPPSHSSGVVTEFGRHRFAATVLQGSCGAAVACRCTKQTSSFTGLGWRVAGLMTDYMASRRAGESVRCEDYRPHDQPPACRDAYSDVVWWSTSTSFLTNSVLTFLMVCLRRVRNAMDCTELEKCRGFEKASADNVLVWICAALLVDSSCPGQVNAPAKHLHDRRTRAGPGSELALSHKLQTRSCSIGVCPKQCQCC